MQSYKEILALNHAGLYEPLELTAMSTVFSDRKAGISIQINADENRVGLPYFKYYNSFQYSKATKLPELALNLQTTLFIKIQIENKIGI